MRSIVFESDTAATMHAHVREGYPHEVVGILAGQQTGETSRVTAIAALVNERSDSAHNRYEVSGLTLMKAERTLEAEGHTILGYYHSHPDHPAKYSEYDRDHALPNLSYVICAVTADGVTDTRSWRLVEDRSAMDEESVDLPVDTGASP
jgi:proteasome lid subunit RPN8/RPN11